MGTLVVAVGGLALLVANGKLTSLTTAAETFGKTRDAQIRLQPVSAWPDRLLKEDGWTQTIAASDRIIWESQPPAPKGSEPPLPTDLLVRSNEETLAWVRVLPFGDRYVWPYGAQSDRLKDGNADVEVLAVVSRLGIGDFVRSSERALVEIVGVGLESSHGGDPNDDTRMLSWERSVLLAQAAGQSLTVTDPMKPIRFRGLSLGRALKAEERETIAEQRQRSALIVAVAFLKYDTVNLRLDEELLRPILNLRLHGVNLMGYEYSYAAMPRLTDAIAVTGGGDGPLDQPTMTADEAVARRPPGSKR